MQGVCMNIEQLLLQPESKTLEFKQDLSSLVPILKTIVAFANTAGGTLVIGLSSKGELKGVDNILREEERLANAIADNILPLIVPEIEMTTYQEKSLLIVKVAYWKGPFYLRKEGQELGTYVRVGSTSRPTSPEVLRELKRSSVAPSFDQEILHHLTIESLDFTKIEHYFGLVGKVVSHDNLRSMGVLASDGNGCVPSVGGLILFGKPAIRQQVLPDARVRCARFLGRDKANILDQLEVDGTIVDAVEAVAKFISRNSRLTSVFDSWQRTDIPEFPPKAVREVLINALVHCDYSIMGSHIQIAIFDDRLEIQSPGMLPFGFTLEDLKSGVSHVRNRVIVRVFHELKFMEQWGSGYKRVVEDCHAGNYPYELPKWEELGTVVRVTFTPHKKAEMMFHEEMAKYHVPALRDLLPRQLAVLEAFREDYFVSFRELSKRLPQIPSRTLHHDLAHLRDNGWVSSKGKGRALVWSRNHKRPG